MRYATLPPSPARDVAVDRLTIAVQLALRASGIGSGRVSITVIEERPRVFP